VTVNREELAKKMADERIGKIVNASAAQAQTDADQAAKRQVKIMHKAYRNEMDKEIEARKSVINATKQADKVKHKAEKEKRKLDKLEADAEDSVRAIDMAKAKKKAVKKEAEETELESKREIERIQDKKTEDMLKIKEEVSDIFQEAQKKANHYHKLAAKFNAELNEAKLKGQAQANATKAAEEEEIKKLDAKSSPAAIIAQAQQGTASKEAKKRHAANLQKRKALIAGQQRKVEAQKKGFQKALKHEAAVFKKEQQQVKAAAQQRKEDSKAEAAATDGERQVHQEMENALNPKPSPQDICTEQCNKECA